MVISMYLKKVSHSVQVHMEKYSLVTAAFLYTDFCSQETGKMSVPFECFCKSSLPVSTLQRAVCNCFHCSSQREHVIINKKYIKRIKAIQSLGMLKQKLQDLHFPKQRCAPLQYTLQWQPIGKLDQGTQVI